MTLKNAYTLIGLSMCLLLVSGCSTLAMERYIAQEEAVDTETYAYQDENFTYNEEIVQELANRFRNESLTTTNVNSIMEDEIENGRYNEVIIYLRELRAEEEEAAAAPYSQRYMDALQAHVERTSEPSEPLVEDAVNLMEQQYQLDPEDEKTTLNYAKLLLNSGYDIDKGAQLLFDLEEEVTAKEEQPGTDLLLALARAYFALGELDESLERYQRLTALDSENPTHYYRMSEVYTAMGDEKGRRDALTKAFQPTAEFLEQYGDDTFTIYEDYLNASID
ncbi:TPR repeat-containing protein [Alteribacillus persepolensis]|uniref:TPR repeat-containing protein n=1 Tax=Alteribacillus persepolensis TaxID=568899 RepID=A0A1G8ACJ7_9BACI|nr:tetratricopeptide repeat protein [Alteribacillus persepolensis]SDH18668.1 TPR repeat-containing protein [Alteribacillus persepolensis]